LELQFGSTEGIYVPSLLAVENGIVCILDTRSMPQQCPNYPRTAYRDPNYPGMFNAQLHFLKAGVQYDLNIQPTKAQDEKFGQPIRHFHLQQNFPNTFNSSTSIRFILGQEAKIKLQIYSINGKLIKPLTTGFYNSGDHAVAWDGKDDNGYTVASGVYLCCLLSGKEISSRKITMLR
jgi:hypothetical protein